MNHSSAEKKWRSRKIPHAYVSAGGKKIHQRGGGRGEHFPREGRGEGELPYLSSKRNALRRGLDLRPVEGREILCTPEPLTSLE